MRYCCSEVAPLRCRSSYVVSCFRSGQLGTGCVSNPCRDAAVATLRRETFRLSRIYYFALEYSFAWPRRAMTQNSAIRSASWAPEPVPVIRRASPQALTAAIIRSRWPQPITPVTVLIAAGSRSASHGSSATICRYQVPKSPHRPAHAPRSPNPLFGCYFRLAR